MGQQETVNGEDGAPVGGGCSYPSRLLLVFDRLMITGKRNRSLKSGPLVVNELS